MQNKNQTKETCTHETKKLKKWKTTWQIKNVGWKKEWCKKKIVANNNINARCKNSCDAREAMMP